MPVSCALDDELGVYRITLSGQLTDEEIVEAAEHMLRDPARAPGLHELVDARDVRLQDASSRAIRQVAEMFSGGPRPERGVRIAFVAPADAAFGLARMYESLRHQSPAEFRTFRDMDEALRWLAGGT